MGEGNFPHGSMFGECSLLASYAELSPRMTFALFEAGRTRNTGELMRLQHAFQAMSTGLWAQPAAGPHMDGAYDKMLVKLGMLPEFPLRLLSPYQGLHRGRLPRVPALPLRALQRLARAPARHRPTAERPKPDSWRQPWTSSSSRRTPTTSSTGSAAR